MPFEFEQIMINVCVCRFWFCFASSLALSIILPPLPSALSRAARAAVLAGHPACADWCLLEGQPPRCAPHARPRTCAIQGRQQWRAQRLVRLPPWINLSACNQTKVSCCIFFFSCSSFFLLLFLCSAGTKSNCFLFLSSSSPPSLTSSKTKTGTLHCIIIQNVDQFICLLTSDWIGIHSSLPSQRPTESDVSLAALPSARQRSLAALYLLKIQALPPKCM